MVSLTRGSWDEIGALGISTDKRPTITIKSPTLRALISMLARRFVSSQFRVASFPSALAHRDSFVRMGVSQLSTLLGVFERRTKKKPTIFGSPNIFGVYLRGEKAAKAFAIRFLRHATDSNGTCSLRAPLCPCEIIQVPRFSKWLDISELPNNQKDLPFFLQTE